MPKAGTFAVALLGLFAVSGCLPGPNELVGTPGEIGVTAGFLMGLWHGFISLFTFIGSLVSDNVSVYEVHNNGAWYDFGFVLGVMFFYGGSGGAGSRKHGGRSDTQV